MPTEVVMPQMGESITEGTLTKWLKQVGDTIARDEPLFEISTDKVDAEIPSPSAGVLKEIKVKEGDTVAINSVVAVLDAEGSAPATATPAPPPAAEPAKAEAAPAAAAPSAAVGTDVLMPQMGESITEGTITKWLKKVGDTIQRDEPIFEISTDKVDAEIPSPVSGTLTEIKAQEGSTVSINTVVAVIGGGATAPVAAPAPSAPVSQAAAAPAAATATTEVTMPQMGESITEGTITKWLKKVGDTVQRDEPIFEISTDKVDAEIPSPAAGVLTEIKAKEGDTVAINTVVALIGGAAGSSAPAPASTPAPQAAAVAEPVASSGEMPRSSPLVRKMAKDNGIDLSSTGIAGSGSAGRVTKNDMVSYMQNGGKPAAAAQPAAPAQPSPTSKPSVPGTPSHSIAQVTSGAGTSVTSARQEASTAQSAPATTAPAKAAAESAPVLGEVVPMTKMRAIIAKRMVESKQTSAHVHTVFKVDMTRIVRLREKEKNKYEQRNGVKLTFMPFITRAAVEALRKHPIVNAAVEGQNIRYNRNINIGIAVALDWGLIVPVLKQLEEKNFLGIARGIVDIAGRARSKKLAPDEVAGGTFTLTNSGIFGEQFGTPVINQPQAAILGIGGLNKEPLVIQDQDGADVIAIRSIQRFTLGFDHRIIDGSDAGKFMTDFKNVLENWSEDIG
ncbi:MAG: 2-oxo acid dehydrogenase subunit E2 [Janthinobacterium lividum]